VFGIGIRDGLESESESESVGGTDGVDANFANLHEFPGQDRCRRLPVNPQWFARIGAIRVRLFFIRVIRVIRGSIFRAFRSSLINRKELKDRKGRRPRISAFSVVG